MKYNENTESLSSSSLSSSCSDGNVNDVISQPNYKINLVISKTGKSSSELEANSSEDDGSASSVNTNSCQEEKQKLPHSANRKAFLQKGGPPCHQQLNAARKDSSVLPLKGEWPEATADGTKDSRAATKGSSEKVEAWTATRQGGGSGVHLKGEGKNPLDKEVSNLLLQMLQERSPPPTTTMPSTTMTRGGSRQHEQITLVKSNSVSATQGDNILKLDYMHTSSNIYGASHSSNKVGLHRLSTGDSPLYVQKRYGSQGPASLIRGGFPSPGTPSRSSFSGMPTYNKAYMVGRIAITEGSGKLLPLYNLPPSSGSDQDTINPGRLSVGFSSRPAPLPSKWDDAEKWLVSSSPSHPSQLPPHPPSKQATHTLVESKKTSKRIINVVAPSSSSPSHSPYAAHTSKGGTHMLHQSRSLVPLPSPSTNSHSYEEAAATMSDSEVANTQEECKVFVRSTSHKHMKEGDYGGKHRNYKGQVSRKSILVNNSKEEELHVSSPVTLQLERLKLGSTTTNAHHELLPRMHDIYAVETPRHVGSSADAAPCGSDDAEEGARGGGLTRLVVQAGKVVGRWGAGAMRDASTDVSPKLSMSRRDMGTQMTPVASTKTSRSATPLKNRSPVRHNTPTRAKSAATSAHSPARSKAAPHSPSRSADPHHLELQNFHLAKLENGHVSCHAGSESSATSVSTTSHETSSSSWKSLQVDNASDQSSSHNVQEPFKGQDTSAAAPQYSAWEEAERSKHMTKCAREEARIDAWESHQKAKAEAEMKKLEMKLERMRAQATEKIINKVSAAHLRAEEMRAAVRAQQAEQLAKALERANSISRKGGGYFQESLGVCFSILP